MPASPVRGRDIRVRSVRVRGGCAANVAAIDAESGGSPRFVGQVGDDTIGRTLVEDLRNRGVDSLVHHAGGTGVAITMIGGGTRTRLVDRGASRRMVSIEPGVLDGIAQLYLEAAVFSDDPFASAIDRLLGEIGDRRIDIVMTGPAGIDLERIGASAFLALVAEIRPDSVVLNKADHAALGLEPRLPIPGADNTVITAGPRPTLVLDRKGASTSVEVRPVDNIRDTTGARDGFVAGYMASRRAGADPRSATNAGHRVAAKVISRLGPTTIG